MSDVLAVRSSTVLLSSCKLMPAAFMESIYIIFGLHFFLLPSIFLSIIVFPKNPAFSQCAQSRMASVCHFYLQWCFRLICFRTHLFIFLAVQGICRTLLQLHISNWSFFSPYKPSLLYIVIENTRMWMILALIFKDISLLLVIFPNPSIAPLPNLSFFLIS